MEIWRDDGRSQEEQPTLDYVVLCSEDRVATIGLFTLILEHVRTAQGKGFMSSVRFHYGNINNGSVHLGVDELDHLAAAKEGMSMLFDSLEYLYTF
jgi:hypothetical protein